MKSDVKKVRDTQIAVNLDPDIYDALLKQAEAESRSVAGQARHYIRQGLKTSEPR